MLVALREFHDIGETHDRTDCRYQRVIDHGLRKGFHDISRQTANQTHDETGAEQHQTGFVLFDDEYEGENYQNTSSNQHNKNLQTIIVF